MVQALGGSEDGSVQLVLTRDGWQPRSPEAAPADSLVFQDRAPLAAVPALLESLRLKWDSYAGHWHFKMTRKFAETFTDWLRSVPPEVTVPHTRSRDSRSNNASPCLRHARRNISRLDSFFDRAVPAGARWRFAGWDSH